MGKIQLVARAPSAASRSSSIVGVAYPWLLEVTFKKAPRARKAAEEQMPLGGTEIEEPF